MASLKYMGKCAANDSNCVKTFAFEMLTIWRKPKQKMYNNCGYELNYVWGCLCNRSISIKANIIRIIVIVDCHLGLTLSLLSFLGKQKSMWCQVTKLHVTSFDVMWHHVMSYDVTWSHVTSSELLFTKKIAKDIIEQLHNNEKTKQRYSVLVVE